MWRSVFLHEFLDHRIDNFSALPGRPEQPSFLLTPSRDPATGVRIVDDELSSWPVQTFVEIPIIDDSLPEPGRNDLARILGP
jgi:hypothetical protein